MDLGGLRISESPPSSPVPRVMMANGFGSLWLQGVALTLPSLSEEFGVSEANVRYTTCALFIGLCLGASFWGIGSDIIGRRLAFNCTLCLAGVFGIAAGAAPNWIGACGLFAALGVGVGGNLPVDGALFLEFLPNTSGGLLTLLSVWWPVGQLVASLIGWAFLGGNYAVDEGWRYFVYTSTEPILVSQPLPSATSTKKMLIVHSSGSIDILHVPFSVSSLSSL